MKNRILYTLVFIIFISIITGGCLPMRADIEDPDYAKAGEGLQIFSGEIYSGDNDQLNGMKVVQENTKYIFLIDEQTTDIAILSKEDGYIYLSNPFRYKEEKPSKEFIAKNCSSLNLEFYTIQGIRSDYNTISDSVEYRQFEIFEKNEGIRIVYKIGKDMGKEIYPPVLSVEKFDEIYDLLPQYDQQSLKESYSLVLTEEKDSASYKRYISEYSSLEYQDLYIRRDLNTRQKSLLLKALEIVEFSYEDMLIELEKAEYELDIGSVIYQIPLDLNLTKDGLIAEVDSKLIISPQGRFLHQLTILKGFNGITPDVGEGFIFVPDGSGAVVNASGNDLTSTYYTGMYNKDQALSNEQIIIKTAQTVMPIFGIGSLDNAIIGIIEEGASLSNIYARQLNELNSLAYVNSSFTYYERDYRDYTGKLRYGEGIVFPKDPVESLFRIKYGFISSKDTSYNDIAKYYREYLVENGTLHKLEYPGYPLTVEFLGNTRKKTTFAGIPIEVDVPLTTFNDATEITRNLIDSGIEDIQVSFSGIFNGGLNNNNVLKNLKLEKSLGTSDDFKSMIEYFETSSIKFYPRLDIIYAYEKKFFDGFNIKSDAVRRLDMTIATFSDLNPATNKLGNLNRRFIISQDKLPGISEDIIKYFGKYPEINAVSLGSMGTYINSNYKKENIINRNKAEDYYLQSMEKISESGMNLMVDTGNSYTWAYSSDILGVPSGSSGYILEKYAVPVLQMVLHGYIRYTTPPINESSDMRMELLRKLETGSGIYIKLISENNIVFKETSHENLFSISYSGWEDKLPAYYKEAYEILNDVSDQDIAEHIKIQDGVFCTVFSDETRIFVNYNEQSIEVEGINIEPLGYYVSKGRIS